MAQVAVGTSVADISDALADMVAALADTAAE
jgi:hypothetical protein